MLISHKRFPGDNFGKESAIPREQGRKTKKSYEVGGEAGLNKHLTVKASAVLDTSFSWSLKLRIYLVDCMYKLIQNTHLDFVQLRH